MSYYNYFFLFFNDNFIQNIQNVFLLFFNNVLGIILETFLGDSYG